jgi:hypothetical protein
VQPTPNHPQGDGEKEGFGPLFLAQTPTIGVKYPKIGGLMPLVKLNTGVTRQYSDRDAKLLVLVKKGVIVEAEPEQVEPEETETTEENKPKRAYKRKDLRAES